MTVSRPRGRHLAGTVLAVGLAALLASCGGATDGADGGADDQEIPSLATESAPVDDTLETPDRPLIRSDASPEEEERLWAEYQRCLEEHGAPAAAEGSPRSSVGADGVPDDEVEKILAAEAACEDMMPERLWQRAQRTDPTYPDKLREWVTCIRSHGIDAWEDGGFLTFHSLPPEHELEKVHECEEKAFA